MSEKDISENIINNNSEKSKRIKLVLMYTVFLFIAWSYCRLSFFPYLLEFMSAKSYIYSIIEASTKIIIWVVPVLVIINKQDGSIVNYLKFKDKLKESLPITLGLIILMTAVKWYTSTKTSYSIDFYTFLNLFLVVGFIEEVVFRGYLLQRIQEVLNDFWIANILSTLIFVLIHIPILYNANNLTLISLLSIGGLSIGFGYIFKETNNLTSVILLHSFWDLIISIFVTK